MRSRVDLPQPLGPTTVTNSPGDTVNDVRSRARVPSLNVFEMSWNSSAGATIGLGAGRLGSLIVGAGSVIRVSVIRKIKCLVHHHAAGHIHGLARAVVA